MRSIRAQSCLTLCDPRDCSPPGFSVHEMFQARILEWVPFPPPRDLPDPGIKPVFPVSLALAGRFLPLHYPGSPKVITDIVKFKLKIGHNELGWALNPLLLVFL